jgi:hypothetical protein
MLASDAVMICGVPEHASGCRVRGGLEYDLYAFEDAEMVQFVAGCCRGAKVSLSMKFQRSTPEQEEAFAVFVQHVASLVREVHAMK